MKYKQDRFYLDFLDASLFANISGKKLDFSADNIESNIRVYKIKDFVEHIFFRQINATSTPINVRPSEEGCLGNDLSQCVVCSQKVQRTTGFQDFFKNKMSEDQWFELTVVARNRIRVRLIEKTKMSTSSKKTQRKMIEPKFNLCSMEKYCFVYVLMYR